MAEKDRRTSLKILIYGLLIIAAFIVLPLVGAYAFTPGASRFGSDLPDAVVFDSGKITYYPHSGELAVWDTKINDVVVYKIND